MKVNQEGNKKCEICEKSATDLCFNYCYYYWKECSKLIHEEKPKANHKNEETDELVPIEHKCKGHEKVPLVLFWLDDKDIFYNHIINKINKNIFLYLFYRINIPYVSSDQRKTQKHKKHKLISIEDEDTFQEKKYYYWRFSKRL